MGRGPTLRKPELDREVRELLRPPRGSELTQRRIALITEVFLRAVLHGIAHRGTVEIQGFGKFHRKWVRQKMVVEFTPTQYLSGLTKLSGWFEEEEENMDKFGVDQGRDEDNEKRASEGCPKCGKKLIEQGKVLLCPIHGSEPFEQEPKK